MNCTPPDYLPPSLLDLNWNSHSLQPTSPTAPNTQLPTDISYQYMLLPLHSPPDLHLSMTDHHHHQSDIRGLPMPGKLTPVPPHLAPLPADPGFVERAARLSCFGGRNYSSLTSQFALGDGDAFLGPLSCDAEQRNAEPSASSDPVSAGEGNARKRKTAAPKGKGKDPKRGDGEDLCAKRSRLAEDANAEEGEIKPKTEQNCIDGDQGKKNNDKLTEPPKDYIHVRARRGQATDSHSLAERVRREKISERMKLLQDLVPGCNKVTGKALMLDEIINYVQSLQRQVEFLSMKLASVHPRLEINMDSVLPKEMHQTSSGSPNSVYPLETSPSAFPYTQHPQQGNQNHLHCLVTNGLETQCAMNRLEPSLHQTLGLQLPPVEGFGDAASQLRTLWQEDLQNVVQMNFGQSHGMHFPSQGFHGC